MMIKRLFDLVIALLILFFLLPLIVILVILVRINMGSPVLYAQVRPGKDGKPFKMRKFRSMTNETDKDGNLLPGKNRITPFGRLLRSSSMDELPGLLSVIRGDMSIVGPRPLLMEYLPLYNEHQKRRHEVRPGITGWAQVNGRNSLEWEDKFDLDVWYVDNRNLLVDIRILFMTVVKVIRRSDIAKQKDFTPKFKGTQNKAS